MRCGVKRKNAFFIPAVRAGSCRAARQVRLRRWSFLCMMLVAMLAVAGVTVQTVKVYEIVAANKSIREVNMDNRVLENKAANLVIELDFEKRDEVICLQATQMLGMIMPESSRIVVLPGQNAANGNLQIASANIR